PIETIKTLFVVDDVIALPIQLGNDLRAGRAFDVVLAHRAFAAGRQAVGFALRGVHRLPEVRRHAFAADARNAAIHQDDVDHRYLDLPRKVQNLLRTRYDALRVLGL